jgi:hypothetical protein
MIWVNAGASRVAVRKYAVPQNGALTYLLGDHLGSASLAVDSVTGETIETRYKPWGEVRFATADKSLPTRYTFTGQFSHVSDEIAPILLPCTLPNIKPAIPFFLDDILRSCQFRTRVSPKIGTCSFPARRSLPAAGMNIY